MNIQGLQKLTLLDYPGKVACTIFFAGCNFRCPFCHNAALVTHIDPEENIPREEVLAFLRKRAGILDGVCITGGEPLLAPDLEAFIRAIKALGYEVKLDTNGSNAEKLKHLVKAGIIDYVAMDIKNSPEKYGMTIGIEGLRCPTSCRAQPFSWRGTFLMSSVPRWSGNFISGRILKQ